MPIVDSILISEQAHCPGALMVGYTALFLQGEGGRGLAVRSRVSVPFKRRAVTVVVSGPAHQHQVERFAVSWAAGDDRTKRTFEGELYIGRGIAPHAGAIVLSGKFLHKSGHRDRAAGAGRSMALAVGRALLKHVRAAVEHAHGIDQLPEHARAYALRYTN